MGDFNINLLNYDTHTDTAEFLDTLATYCFQPHIIKPTRITDHSATLIDHIYFNSTEHRTVSGNILCDITDHLPNFLIINKFSNNFSKPKTAIFRRDYSNFASDEFLNEVKSVRWEEVFPIQADANDIFNSFHAKITEIVDKHVPLKKVSKRQLLLTAKPWITSGIKKSIKTKSYLYKSYLKTKNSYYLSKYKHYRNKLKHLIQISKKTYFNNYFISKSNNIKDTWKGIKQIISTKRNKTCSLPTTINVANKNITDTQKIADEFNKYFANIGNNLASAIPKSKASFELYLRNSPANSFALFPASENEIENIIECLNISKSSGPYSIPTKLLKILKSTISVPLMHIINLSFSTGIMPEKLKIARVIPIFKKGQRDDISNYRPISLLSVFNKIIETIVYNRLIKFIEKNELLFSNQFGFRTSHSTTHAIILIVDKIQKAIERKEFSCGIFLDLCKAFDTVDHKILLKKLEYYGVRGIANDWFCSYLSNRKQFVSIGNYISEMCSITCGVPQGSVLGPLLFLLYINDFSSSAEGIEFHLFADDSNLFYSHRNLHSLEEKLNHELNNINEWLRANKLSLNVEKSNFVIFHPHQRKVLIPVNLKICNKFLEEKKCFKYLGVFIDYNLTWKYHIRELEKKISRNIGILSKLRHFVPRDLLLQIYYSIIFPFFTYGIIIWGNNYKTTLNPLVTLQKKAVRIITFSHFQSHTSPIFKKLNLLKLPDIIKLHTIIFMHKYYHNRLPKAFNDFFSLVKLHHQYNTRLASRTTYTLPLIRTNYGLHNIRFYGPKLWNLVDEELKSLSAFSMKSKLKSRFISDY